MSSVYCEIDCDLINWTQMLCEWERRKIAIKVSHVTIKDGKLNTLRHNMVYSFMGIQT